MQRNLLAMPVGKLPRVALVLCATITLGTASADDRNRGVPIDLATRTAVHESVGRALQYLVAAQRADGGWEAFGESHPAITALAVKCLIQDDRYGAKHPVVKRALAYVLRFAQPDGGIFVAGEGMRNYHTSVALMALAATKNPVHAERIRDAQRYLKELQWDQSESIETSSTWYGGQGYGRHKRPDLSNTQMMLEALHQSGLPAADPAYQKAMTFISRCQMLDSTNDQPLADGSKDGGFVYTPVNGGESKAGTVVGEGQPRLRSYGSMTYAGFKSMLYAKLDRDDVRIKRAVAWIQDHFTLDGNPNMPGDQSKQGLYYFLHIFSRAMHAWGEESITDTHGKTHRWRIELCKKLMSLQRPDGSWVNQEDRWYEGNPHLVTAYAVLAMQTAQTP